MQLFVQARKSAAATVAYQSCSKPVLASLSPTKASSAVKTAASRAELRQAGLADQAINYLFERYPPYSGWDVEKKMRPAIQAWQNELGTKAFPAKFAYWPFLLRHTPEAIQQLRQWLASLGVVDTDKALHSVPMLLDCRLWSLQANLADLQARNMPHLLHIIKQHPGVLCHSPQRVQSACAAAIEALDMNVLSTETADFLSAAGRYLFGHSTSVMLNRYSSFCKKYSLTQCGVKQAFTSGIFTMTEDTIQQNADALKHKLCLNDADTKKIVSSHPKILTFSTDSVQRHVDVLVSLGFTVSQVKTMSLLQPNIVCFNFKSVQMTEKWEFLTRVMSCDSDTLTAHPKMLARSLHNVLGPRHAFVLQLVGDGILMQGASKEWLCKHCCNSEIRVQQVFANVSTRHYDGDFKRQWRHRWLYLTNKHQQSFSIEDIAAHDMVLLASVKDTLGPRLSFLRALAVQQSSVSLTDSLTAVATLTDEEFAGVFDLPGCGLAYTAEYVGEWQSSHKHVYALP